NRRARGRHGRVRGGDDEGGAGGGERKRSTAGRRLGFFAGTSGPCKLARIVDGTTRPARSRQGVGANRGGDRTRVLPSSASCGRAQAGGGAANGARPSYFGWVAAPAGVRAVRGLIFQALTGTGLRF